MAEVEARKEVAKCQCEEVLQEISTERVVGMAHHAQNGVASPRPGTCEAVMSPACPQYDSYGADRRANLFSQVLENRVA